MENSIVKLKNVLSIYTEVQTLIKMKRKMLKLFNHLPIWPLKVVTLIVGPLDHQHSVHYPSVAHEAQNFNQIN